MTDWSKCPVPLSRNMVIAFNREEAEAVREQRAREQAAAEARETAEGRAIAYYRANGEWEWQTRAREQDRLARTEHLAEQKRQAERHERWQADIARMIQAGARPKSVGEILAAAALYP